MIDRNALTSYWIRFQKNFFQAAFSTMAIAYEHAERTTGMLLENAFWIPKENIRIIQEWGRTFKQERNQWKRCVDNNFQSFEGLFSSAAETSAEKP